MSFRERLLALAEEYEALEEHCVALESRDLRIHASGGTWPPVSPSTRIDIASRWVPQTPKDEFFNAASVPEACFSSSPSTVDYASTSILSDEKGPCCSTSTADYPSTSILLDEKLPASAGGVAKSKFPTRLSASTIKASQAMTVLAWKECHFDFEVFWKSFVYELFPTFISGPLCCLFEGLESAKNRSLMYSWAGLKHPFNIPIVMDILFTLGPWSILIMTLALETPQNALSYSYFPMLLLVWRASVIAMKYAYMQCNDIASIRGGNTWRNSMLNFRSLGNGIHFDTLGTLTFDILNVLYMSSLRCDILEELATSWTHVGVDIARPIWDRARWNLSKADNPRRISKTALFPGASSYARVTTAGVDVQRSLLLHDLESIDDQALHGRLSAATLAYHLVSSSFKSTPKSVFFGLIFLGMSVGFLMPVARALSGVTSFGDSIEANVVLSVRVWVVACGMFPSTLFMAYPVLDAWKRYCLSKTLLAMFGDQEILGRLKQTSELQMDLNSIEDLRMFWLLSRVLGPTLNMGLSKRYGSAYVLVLAVFCTSGLGLLYMEVNVVQNELPWGFVAELAFFSLWGTIAIFMTASICTAVNMHLDNFLGLVRRAIVRNHADPDFVQLAEAIAEDLEVHHGRAHPIKIAYMPANPSVLLFIRSALTALVFGLFTIIQEAYRISILPW